MSTTKNGPKIRDGAPAPISQKISTKLGKTACRVKKEMNEPVDPDSTHAAGSDVDTIVSCQNKNVNKTSLNTRTQGKEETTEQRTISVSEKTTRDQQDNKNAHQTTDRKRAEVKQSKTTRRTNSKTKKKRRKTKQQVKKKYAYVGKDKNCYYSAFTQHGVHARLPAGPGKPSSGSGDPRPRPLPPLRPVPSRPFIRP